MSTTTKRAVAPKPKLKAKTSAKAPQRAARDPRSGKPPAKSSIADLSENAEIRSVDQPHANDASTASATTDDGADTRKAEGKASGLDAAAQIMREAGEPLAMKIVVQRMLERGLWRTKGKTPEATIYAAVIREIRAKGGQSRFQKVDRGRFIAVR